MQHEDSSKIELGDIDFEIFKQQAQEIIELLFQINESFDFAGISMKAGSQEQDPVVSSSEASGYSPLAKQLKGSTFFYITKDNDRAVRNLVENQAEIAKYLIERLSRQIKLIKEGLLMYFKGVGFPNKDSRRILEEEGLNIPGEKDLRYAAAEKKIYLAYEQIVTKHLKIIHDYFLNELKPNKSLKIDLSNTQVGSKEVPTRAGKNTLTISMSIPNKAAYGGDYREVNFTQYGDYQYINYYDFDSRPVEPKGRANANFLIDLKPKAYHDSQKKLEDSLKILSEWDLIKKQLESKGVPDFEILKFKHEEE